MHPMPHHESMKNCSSQEKEKIHNRKIITRDAKGGKILYNKEEIKRREIKAALLKSIKVKNERQIQDSGYYNKNKDPHTPVDRRS